MFSTFFFFALLCCFCYSRCFGTIKPVIVVAELIFSSLFAEIMSSNDSLGKPKARLAVLSAYAESEGQTGYYMLNQWIQ